MKNFVLSEENLKKLYMVHDKLGLIEVKGDSVEHLFASRLLVKQIAESLTEITGKTEEPKGDLKKEE